MSVVTSGPVMCWCIRPAGGMRASHRITYRRSSRMKLLIRRQPLRFSRCYEAQSLPSRLLLQPPRRPHMAARRRAELLRNAPTGKTPRDAKIGARLSTLKLDRLFSCPLPLIFLFIFVHGGFCFVTDIWHLVSSPQSDSLRLLSLGCSEYVKRWQKINTRPGTKTGESSRGD